MLPQQQEAHFRPITIVIFRYSPLEPSALIRTVQTLLVMLKFCSFRHPYLPSLFLAALTKLGSDHPQRRAPALGYPG